MFNFIRGPFITEDYNCFPYVLVGMAERLSNLPKGIERDVRLWGLLWVPLPHIMPELFLLSLQHRTIP